ncbi:MAG: ATP-binding protein [Sedimentibacter sp.]
MTQIMLSNLLIYRNLLEDEIVYEYEKLLLGYFKQNELGKNEIYSNGYYNLCSKLLYSGYDSIDDYISYKILSDENIFSLKREQGHTVEEKVKQAVLHDIALFKKLFELPLKGMSDNAGDINSFINYQSKEKLTEIFKNKGIEEIYEFIYTEYETNGCGEYRNNFAFSITEQGQIVPVENFNPVNMNNIYGYENQKNKIIKNTDKFLSNEFALNALLVGDSGTGKSTTVKSLIPVFKNRKLRLIEVEKKNLHFISKIIDILKNRGMYFIIFIDDLSFESNENSYKYLKSAVEGSIYEQPSNILFYVTSNRKHLIKESMVERQNEVHLRDAINEQTSLSERFGLTILYSEPNQNEFYEIVLGLAEKHAIKYDSKEQLFADAKKFAMQNGGRSGRTAVQFVKTYI